MATAQASTTKWAGSLEPSPAGPIDEAEAATLAKPPADPMPRALQVLRFSQRQIEFVFRNRRDARPRVPRQGRDPRRPHGDQPPRPREVAVHGQARAGAVADRRVAAAADPGLGLGADLGRRPPHAPAQAAAAAVPRRGGGALRGDDRRGHRARAGLVAGGRADGAGAADAGHHARRDHARDLRRGRPAEGHARVRAARGHPPPDRAVDQADRADRRADQPGPRRAGRPDQAGDEADRQADLPGDRRPPPRHRPGRAHRHHVAADARPHRGRRGADRPGAARRAADPGAGRARDHGQPAGLDVGAPGALARGARAPDRGRAHRRRATPTTWSSRPSTRACARAR